MEKEFDKKKYDIEYIKKHKKQFKVDLNIDEMETLNELLKKLGMTKAQFVREALEELKKRKQ